MLSLCLSPSYAVMQTTHLAASLLLLASLFSAGWSLRCYSCAGTCNDPYEGNKHQDTTCPNSTVSCFKYIVNTNGHQSTFRGCAMFHGAEYCGTMKLMPGSRKQSCSTCPEDLCNVATRTTSFYIWTILLPLLYFIM